MIGAFDVLLAIKPTNRVGALKPMSGSAWVGRHADDGAALANNQPPLCHEFISITSVIRPEEMALDERKQTAGWT